MIFVVDKLAHMRQGYVFGGINGILATVYTNNVSAVCRAANLVCRESIGSSNMDLFES